MAIPTPGAGIKVGTAYVDIVPKLDKLTNAKVLAEVNKELQKAYTPNYDQLNADQKKNQEIQARSAQQTTSAILKNRLDQQKAADKVLADADRQASNDRQKVAKAETAAYQEEFRRRGAIQKQVSRDYDSALKETSRLEADAARNRDSQNNKSEGILHKLATQFRTIGTLARGLSVISVGFLGLQALEKSIGFIQAAMPAVTAGLVALPGLISAAAVEAGILHIAFKNVGSAIKDGFDPTKVKQFNQEMSKLAPGARSFVNDILKLKDLKLPNLQQSLFGNATLQAAGKGIAPTAQKLAPGTAGVASATGGALGTLLGGLETKSAVQNIKDLFNGMAAGIKNVTPGLAVLEAGFLHLVGQDGLFGGKAGTAVSHFFTTIGNGLGKVNVAQVFHDGGIALNGFLGIAKNVLGTIGGIVSAMGTAGSGAGFLSSVTAVTAEFNKFANSASGQKFLVQLFKSLNDIAKLIDTVVKDALAFLAGAFANLEPAINATSKTLGKVLTDLVPLGPVVGTIASAALNLANILLKLLEPSLRLVVDLLAEIPKPVLEGIATGLIAIYLAFKAFSIVKGIVIAIQAWTKAQLALDLALDANPIALVVIAVAALAVGIVYLATKTQFFQTVWKGLETAFKTTLKFLTSGFGQLTLLLLGPLGALALLALHWKQVWAGIRSVYSGALSFFKTVGADIRQFFVVTVPSWFDTLKKRIDGVFDGVRKDILNWWHNVLAFFVNNVLHFIESTVPGWFDTARHNVARAFNGIYSDLKKWWHDVLTFFVSNVPHFITSTVPSWFDTARHAIAHTFDLIRDRIKTFIHTDIIGVFNTVKNFLLVTVPGWFSTLQHDILAAVRFLVNGIQDIWRTIVGVFASPISSVVNVVMSGAHGLVDAWNAIDHAIGGKHQMSKPKFVAPGPPSHVTVPSSATGGPIPKALGGPTQDNVFLKGIGSFGYPGINVSGGEYVLNAQAVASIPPGYLDALNRVGGQAISGDPSGIHIFDPQRQRYSVGGRVEGYAKGGSIPAAAAARVPATLNWLHSIAGRIPYVLGGNGPNSFDCSSLVGNVWARLTGNPINRRYFVTGTEAGWLGSHGFAGGGDPSGFTVGLTSPPEHTVGILAGHRFEAAHTGTKMRFDDGAANAMHFARVFHMIGLSGLGGAIGSLIPAAIEAVRTPQLFAKKFNAIVAKTQLPQTGYTPEAGLVNPQQVVNMNTFSQNIIKAFIAQAQATANQSFGAGAALGNVGSSLEDGWIAQASKFSNIPANWVNDLKFIMNHESGGNPNAQNNTDSNARAGIPSQGLMQLIPPNFRHYHAAGTSNNIKDPVANIAAAVNYIHSRYGSVANTPWIRGTGTFYSAGGPVLSRDRGGIIPQGLSQVFNGTGRDEYAFTSEQLSALRHDCYTTVVIDGVDVTSKAHVIKNNKQLAVSLSRK